MNPPLSGLYQDKLADIQRNLQQQNDAGNASGPRSASGTPTTNSASANAGGGS